MKRRNRDFFSLLPSFLSSCVFFPQELRSKKNTNTDDKQEKKNKNGLTILPMWYKNLLFVGILFHVANANSSTCGKDGSKVKDCDHPDLGSCGNACCAVDCVIGTGYDSEEVFEAMKEVLQDHGSDGSFSYSDGSDDSGTIFLICSSLLS